MPRPRRRGSAESRSWELHDAISRRLRAYYAISRYFFGNPARVRRYRRSWSAWSVACRERRMRRILPAGHHPTETRGDPRASIARFGAMLAAHDGDPIHGTGCVAPPTDGQQAAPPGGRAALQQRDRHGASASLISDSRCRRYADAYRAIAACTRRPDYRGGITGVSKPSAKMRSGGPT